MRILKQKVKLLIKKLHTEQKQTSKNNNGASLITVIISIGFVTALVSILLMLSLINFKMKKVNAYAKDTFYSAEQVLDEINIGLQRYISDSLSSAYMDVLENYGDYTAEKKTTILQTKYYESMWGKLEADSGHKTYSTAILESFLKSSTKWRGDPEMGYGAILRVSKLDGTLSTAGDMITYDKTGIVLKNLRVYYKNSKGYVSIIQTDIRIAYPEFDFASSTVLPNVADYGLIADEGIVTQASAGEIILTGDFYADSITSIGTVKNSRMKLTHKGVGQVLIKHDLKLKNASFVNEENATFWAENIAANGSVIALNGQSNLADDLNISGDGSNITLSGIYNGYGNSLEDAESSSAILVNGTNSTLDLSGLKKIILAGHAFIGTKVENTGEVGKTETGKGNNVFTGESVAVKSNQLMYLIPSECIGVSQISGISKYNVNPLTAQQYAEISDITKYSEVSMNVEVPELGGTLGSYLLTKNGVAQPEKIFVTTTDGTQTLVYYYMRFANEEAANNFFSKYYSANKATIDNYMQYYIKGIEFPNTTSVLRLKIAGNAVKGDTEKGYEIQNTVLRNASTKLSENQQQYTEQFTALCTKLIKNYGELTDLYKSPDTKEQIVFDNIVDEDKLEDYVDQSPVKIGNNLVLIGPEGKAVIAKSDYVINDSNIHLVIAEGNVTVDVDHYVGTILCNGKITLTSSNGSITADSETVKTMLHYSQSIGDDNVLIASIFRGGSDFVFASLNAEDEKSDSTSLADLIVYENWKKE